MRTGIKGVLLVFIVLLTLALFSSSSTFAAEECLVCHGQAGFETIIDGKTVSLFVDAKKYSENAHGNIACSGCHIGFSVGPHGDRAMAEYKQIASWACEKCHSGPYKRYMSGSHSKAYKKGHAAPTCIRCHSNHYVVRASDPESSISYLKAPEENCGKCHHEALETYLEGYHGKTLVVLGYKRSASCSKIEWVSPCCFILSG